MYERGKFSPSLFVESVPVEGGAKTFTPDLQGLIAWLETQEMRTTYQDMSINDCLVCRFFSVIAGEPVDWIDALGMTPSDKFDAIWEVAVVPRGVSTYSKALSRARAALARS